MELKNLFESLRADPTAERFEPILREKDITIERIVSCGQSTPPGEWLCEPTSEWVAVIQGHAGLQFEEPAEEISLGPGDYVFIPASTRHRVTRTSTEPPTVWLAIHF